MEDKKVRKRPSNDVGGINWDKCLCHVKRNANGKLTPFAEKSWNKFKKSSNARKDTIWYSMKDNWLKGPNGGYHRECYQQYTNIQKTSRCETSTGTNLPNEQHDQPFTEPPAKRLCSSQIPSFDIAKCIICQKERIAKRSKGMPRTREALTQNISEDGRNTLLKAARIRNDNQILLQIEGQDSIALQIKYHRSCYKDYVRQETLKKLDEEFQPENFSSNTTYEDAFEQIKEYVHSEIILNAKVIKMSDLNEKFITELALRGVEASNYKSSRLKLRLKKCFGQQLSFRQPKTRNQPDLVYSSQVKKGDIVEAMVTSSATIHAESEELQTVGVNIAYEDDNTASQIYHVSKLIRRLVLEMKPSMSWPPNPQDLDNVVLPDMLYNMFAWLLSPITEFCHTRVSDISPDVHRLVLSLTQDLIHCVTRGRIKTPKHVVLPVTIKSLTGNAEVITILNRFGHGLSYSQIEELETALAEKEVGKQQNDVLLPSACSPGVPAVFCWDNNDLQEETLSGKGTTHCTNGIVIQRKPLTCALPPDMTDDPPRSKRRSISNVSDDVLPYHSGPRQGPSPVNIDVNILLQRNLHERESAAMKDFAWMLCRRSYQDTFWEIDKDQQQSVPAWTGFNMTLLEGKAPRECIIGYCPVIEASPTELPTVYTLLQRSLKMADQLEQKDVIVVFDQAIYAKVLEVAWQNQQQFQRLVVRMGSFHVICAFLAAIGKRFGDAGLADIIVESGIVGSGSVTGVLEGKHYNRAVRTHKIIFEAMHRVQWQGFKAWLKQKNRPTNYAALVGKVKKIRQDFELKKFEMLVSSDELEELSHLYDEYCKESNGPMKRFWNTYLEMVATLMHFIRATREGSWSLHLDCIKNMLPWFFAYDHVNYARYLPVYLVQMETLQDTHPEAHQQLTDGDFGVQRSTTNGFTRIPVDQTIEQTLNRSTKTKGGIIGFSLRKGAVQKWILTAHSRAVFADKCREMTSTKKDVVRVHKEVSPSRMEKDEKDVKKVMEVVENWCNPFEASEDITSIGSGFVASESMKRDLLNAEEIGKVALIKFVKNRIQTNSTGFHEPLSKMNLGTFRDAQKRKSIKTGDRSVIVRADRNLFARLLVIGQSRHVDLRELLSHELGLFPWSLAALDGSFAKTNKAILPKLLESKVECLACPPPDTTAIVIDAMAFLQAIVRVPDRFGDLAEMTLNGILAQAGTAQRIDFVADQYPDISIKNTERNKRGQEGQILFKINSRQQQCPRQWKKFMAHGLNKTRLMHFLVHEWSTHNYVYADKIAGRTLYVTHGSDCTKIEVIDGKLVSCIVLDLCSSQEEADTRMFLHVQHASTSGNTQISIKSSDTDVEVLACYFQKSIAASITLISGTRSRSRLISIPKICQEIGEEVCQVLPSLHALTGCDTVSTFVGKGKRKALKLVVEDAELRSNISTLGETVPLEDTRNIEKFVCTLYHDKDCGDINEVRYKMFCKGKNLQSYHLPPTQSSLVYHIKRANYQAYLWKHALENTAAIPTPDGQGWQVKNNQIDVAWTDLPPAPDGVMQLLSCGCKGTCQSRRCSCVKNGLPCTEACECGDDCVNSAVQELGDDDEDMGSDDEDEGSGPSDDDD